MEAITIQHLKKSYKDNEVLKDISLSVKCGEVFTLLGENGSGKTTLINILCTLLRPSSGKVMIMNEPLDKNQEKIRKLISLNSQSNTLDEEFSGYENLKLIAELRGIDNVKSEVNKLSKRLNLTPFLNRKVASYSGGMKRRLDIAMSLIGDASIIFLDEPTTGVDPKNRLEIWNIINEIRDSGKTIFLTTQYLEEADLLSDHIGFINDGKIVLYGTPDEIKKNAEEKYIIQVPEKDVAAAEYLLKNENIKFEKNDMGFEINEQLAQKSLKVLIENRITIESFKLMEMNLETIFLNVTGSGERK
ncbi:ATP-binding cassette domain-containing protein [Clostridium tyrobutyricum]|uniref:ABC transporter ATP-binding protein n=1 Tax=Clostridium tyrobutyricum TaxID=1519 RepID=UPI00189E1BF6|nr:ABC transporter ATP-binding protein [Clostridium tyrobutyricum]MBV4440608.1 ATP-binding cassette domain-containing protein [Clostridium tyrobutyricum]MBV4447151.1 ATP-binding cassette domain-containing protein [Clostridium tyrobutyricum]